MSNLKNPSLYPDRVIIENFTSNEQAKRLVEITDEFAVEGYGYDDRHPQLETELYEAVNIEKIENQDKKDFDLSIANRQLQTIQDHFGSQIQIYFTLLVKRTSLKDTEFNEPRPMSHTFHFDVNDSDDFERSHTSIIFLNQDFIGGQFVFKEREDCEIIKIKPRPGKFVAFSCPENEHGVEHIFKGSRYVLISWLTNGRKIK